MEVFMIPKYREITKLALTAALVVETAILIRAAFTIKVQHTALEMLENLSEYYVDILERNDVDLSDYDIIVLNTILG